MKKFLRIKWRNRTEHIEALLGTDQQINEIEQTKEYWPDGKPVVYKTTSEQHSNDDGSQQIRIHYSKEKNSHLLGDPDLPSEFGEPDTWIWGTLTITFSADLNSADAEWIGDSPGQNARVECTVLPQAPLEQKEREVESKIERRQAAFREYLLDQDHCCAITGEKLKDVLDAAHIVAAAARGPGSPDNGILLRADLHRLYDARRFEISYQDGVIEKISDNISDAYKSMLKGKELNETIFARVQAALAKRARLPRGD